MSCLIQPMTSRRGGGQRVKGPSDPTKLHDMGFSALAPASLPLPPGDGRAAVHHESPGDPGPDEAVRGIEGAGAGSR